MTQSVDKAPKARTYAVSLYPEDIDIVRSLAARDFEFNESLAARHIIRKYAELDPTVMPQERTPQ